MQALPTRKEAFALLTEHIKNDSLVKHALSVEAVMRRFAARYGEDVEKWGAIGLVHDIDYERFPDQHCRKCLDIFREAGWPEDWARSAASHGWTICSDIEPTHVMEKVLFAIDELTGLVKASVLMRPSKSVHDLEARSVLKRWKDKRFSAGVDRSIIEKGAAMLGLEIPELIEETILAMRGVAAGIGLQGDPPEETLHKDGER